MSSSPGASAFTFIEDLDVAGTLERAQQLTEDRHRAEVADLEIALQYAALHGHEPENVFVTDREGRRRKLPGATELIQLGGEGTPKVQDLPLCELAIARGVSTFATRNAVADALDLDFRLPKTWTATRSLTCPVWTARKVASMSRKLSKAAAADVDEAVAAVINTGSPAKILGIAEAAIMAADTDQARADREERLRRRCFHIGRSDEDGLRTVFARVEFGDAAWIEAVVHFAADRLAERPDLTPDLANRMEPPTRDELLAEAFGWLAHPDDLAALLRGTLPNQELDARPPTTSPAARTGAVVYVHLHEAATDGSMPDDQVVGWAEDLGPVLLEDIQRLLGHTHVTVVPVQDLNTSRVIDGYVFPEDVRERVHLRIGGDVFPYATSRSRRLDGDHPTPYDPHGPPGQTGDCNSAPLARRHHRAKTHLGYKLHQLSLDSYLWRTPHGMWRLVDPQGTREVDQLTAWELLHPRPE